MSENLFNSSGATVAAVVARSPGVASRNMAAASSGDGPSAGSPAAAISAILLPAAALAPDTNFSGQPPGREGVGPWASLRSECLLSAGPEWLFGCAAACVELGGDCWLECSSAERSASPKAVSRPPRWEWISWRACRACWNIRPSARRRCSLRSLAVFRRLGGASMVQLRKGDSRGLSSLLYRPCARMLGPILIPDQSNRLQNLKNNDTSARPQTDSF